MIKNPKANMFQRLNENGVLECVSMEDIERVGYKSLAGFLWCMIKFNWQSKRMNIRSEYSVRLPLRWF